MFWQAPNLLTAVALGGITAFIGSMPVAGPLAVVVVERALSGHRMSATMVALGGGIVEGAYALCIALTLPLLIEGTGMFIPLSRGVGAVVIAGIGIALLTRPDLFESRGRQGKRRSLLSGIAVTAINPTLLASWTIVVSSLYLQGWLSPEPFSAGCFALGVTAGTTAWFSLVALLGKRLERRMNEHTRRSVMRVMGAGLVGVGIYLGAQVGAAGEPSLHWRWSGPPPGGRFLTSAPQR